MEKGIVYAVDKSRLYIRTASKSICKKCSAKHLCLSSGKSQRIIPVMKRLHHFHLKKGDKVLFEINPRHGLMLSFLFYGIPIVSILVGLIVASIVTQEETGMILITLLFLALGIDIQYMLRRRTSYFREIDVHIMRDVPLIRKGSVRV